MQPILPKRSLGDRRSQQVPLRPELQRPAARLSSIRHRSIAIGLALLAAFFPVDAWAATATTTFTVTATALSVCTVAAQPLSFGNYSPISASPLDATTTVTATCTLNTAYTIGLDNGQNASAGQRRMALATTFLNYELYSDTSRTQRWGSAGAQLVSGTGDGLAQNLTVYGRVPAAQVVGAGAFADVITVTITF